MLKQEFMPKGHISRPGIKMDNPTSITIHWIGPYPKQNPDIVRNWWLKGNDGNGVQASAHYIIKDELITQCIPDHEVAWHCGSAGNYSSIGIEIVPASIVGEFSDESIETLIELLKRLPKLPLVRHYDWTGKDCPRYYTPVTDRKAVDDRVDNPEGGEDRWLELKYMLNKERGE